VLSGDAFVGGFLARYVLGAPLPDCISTAKKVAALVIGRSGCTFPPEVPDDVLVGSEVAL
jgi:adenosine kinase